MPGVSIESMGSTSFVDINPALIFYERRSSTLADPVPAQTIGYKLLRFAKTDPRRLRIMAIGTDQHDNSVYHWFIDGNYIESISGPAAVGTIQNPFVFPYPVRVENSIELLIDNNNGKSYPNDSGTYPADRVPYECVVIGVWG